MSNRDLENCYSWYDFTFLELKIHTVAVISSQYLFGFWSKLKILKLHCMGHHCTKYVEVVLISFTEYLYYSIQLHRGRPYRQGQVIKYGRRPVQCAFQGWKYFDLQLKKATPAAHRVGHWPTGHNCWPPNQIVEVLSFT